MYLPWRSLHKDNISAERKPRLQSTLTDSLVLEGNFASALHFDDVHVRVVEIDLMAGVDLRAFGN
jgi:hypothetical protein